MFSLAYPSLRAAFAIPTHMTKQERVRLFQLAGKARQVVEIGSYLGASAVCFAAAMARAGIDGKVYCVDTWGNETMPEGLRETYSEFQLNTAPYARYVVPMRGRSIDVAHAVKAQATSVDLLFIDGDHSYEAALADWRAYKDLLRPGSWVVFHDWGWAEGVQRVVAEEVAHVVERKGTLPNMWWGRVA